MVVRYESTSDAGRDLLVAVLVFVGLNCLLRVPDLVIERYPMEAAFYLSDPSRLYYFFSLDLFCLFSALVLIPERGDRKWVYYAVTGVFVFLLAYRTYDAVVASVLRRDAIFYADYTHVVGAVYLLLNASIPAWQIVGLFVGGGTLVALAWGLPRLVRIAHRALRGLEIRRGLLATHLLIWPLVGIAAVQERGIERQTYQEVCLLTVQCVGYNIRASIDLQRSTQRRTAHPPDSTYVRYRSLDWANPPSIYLVMLESYGTTLADDPRVASSYDALMRRSGDSLRAAGWHTASARSVAPVFGGLSWLSVATVLTGSPVAHQPTYDVLRPTLGRYPHLVWLLQNQGYEAASLQPPVRVRPGLRVRNPFAFDRTIYFEHLQYRGPAYGWGIVPDQYSLSVAHERFIEETSGPFFLLFETVTSHGRWDRPPPPLVDTPDFLNRPREQIPEEAIVGGLTSESPASTASTSSQPERFFRQVTYDWRVLAEYLRTEAAKNSLVIVLGDHQPFFAEGSSATLVHVLSRDERLVRRFEEYGFGAGLRPSSETKTFHHAGLYSMLIRVLTAHYGSQKDVTPPVHPRGVVRAALLDTAFVTSDRP